MIPKCKDCIYFEEQWDLDSDAGCNCDPKITTLAYPDEKACSAFKPKNKKE